MNHKEVTSLRRHGDADDGFNPDASGSLESLQIASWRDGKQVESVVSDDTHADQHFAPSGNQHHKVREEQPCLPGQHIDVDHGSQRIKEER